MLTRSSQLFRLRPSGYPDIGHESVTLSTNDVLNSRPVYVPVCIFLRVPDQRQNHVIQMLMSGLEKTLLQCRFLAGTIEVNDAGEYCIVSERESTVDFIHHRPDCDEPNQVSAVSYDGLEANNFLIPKTSHVARLRVQTLPFDQRSADPDQSPPVIGFQANLIPGGIALAIHAHHWAMDYCALAAFVHLWAGNTNALSCHAPYPELDPSCLDRSRLVGNCLACAETQTPKSINTLETQAKVPATKSANDLDQSLPFSVYQFRLTKDKADTLKALAASDAGIDSCRISSYDAFVALWWRVLTRARAKFLGLHHLQDPADFIEAVNIRRKVVPPLPDNYLGNAVLFATSVGQRHRLTISDVVESATLGTIAAHIRHITDSVDAIFIQNQLDQIRRCRRQSLSETPVDGPGPLALTVNDWRAHNVHNADFGFGKPSGLKHLFGSMPVLVVLPMKRSKNSLEEHFEFLAPMENAVLDNFLRDPDVRQWFEFQGIESESC